MSLLSKPFDSTREAALVTGAGNGIGRAIAQALVGEGVRTIFADVNRETVTAAVKASARPELAVPWVGDLADAAVRDGLLAEAGAAVGRVTHFVHSASPPRREADHVLGVTTETWAQMHAVNLEAGFHLSRELARKLIADKQPGSFLLLTARRDRGRRLCRRSRARKTHSARPAWRSQGPCAAGAGGAVEPDIGLCHGSRDRDRRRPVADELVPAAGVGGFVEICRMDGAKRYPSRFVDRE